MRATTARALLVGLLALSASCCPGSCWPADELFRAARRPVHGDVLESALVLCRVHACPRAPATGISAPATGISVWCPR